MKSEIDGIFDTDVKYHGNLLWKNLNRELINYSNISELRINQNQYDALIMIRFQYGSLGPNLTKFVITGNGNEAEMRKILSKEIQDYPERMEEIISLYFKQ